MFLYHILIRFVKFTAYYLENISISSRIMQSRKTGAKSLVDVPYIKRFIFKFLILITL